MDWMLILLAVCWFVGGAVTSRVIIAGREDLPPLVTALGCQIVWPALWMLLVIGVILRALYWCMTGK